MLLFQQETVWSEAYIIYTLSPQKSKRGCSKSPPIFLALKTDLFEHAL